MKQAAMVLAAITIVWFIGTMIGKALTAIFGA